MARILTTTLLQEQLEFLVLLVLLGLEQLEPELLLVRQTCVFLSLLAFILGRQF